jgi:homoserine O-acetyltransferase
VYMIELNYNPIRNLYSDFVRDQNFASVDNFKFESGVELKHAIIAYKTWGRLNVEGDNCLVICHALSGSSDVTDWWGPLLGHKRPFDTSRYFVFCANVLGLPYGSSSPLSINPTTGKRYGTEFPQITIRDDVRYAFFQRVYYVIIS